jgi:hypothetical protein
VGDISENTLDKIIWGVKNTPQGFGVPDTKVINEVMQAVQLQIDNEVKS